MLEVKAVRGKFGIFAGKARLDTFKTREQAEAALEEGRATYEYWAGSAGVSVQNTPPKVVRL